MIPQNIILNADKHEIYFSRKPCEALEACRALCCRKWDVNLAYHEYAQGLYEAEAFCALDKTLCLNKAKACPQRAFRLKKKPDGSCVYLDNQNRCAIYANRPIVCRNFSCDKGFSLEPVCSITSEQVDEAEICSFDGGLELKAKFLTNPCLRFKKMKNAKNYQRLIFKDITSCKDKVVDLAGLRPFSGTKQAAYFLKQFNAKNTAAAVMKKMSSKLKRQDFINTVLYLIDEKVLLGVF